MDFASLTDDEWFQTVVGKNGPAVFGTPDEKIQIGTVGVAGEPILYNGFMFYKFCRDMLYIHGNGISDNTYVLDFGCAWGRLIRFWFHKLPPKNIYGLEVQERFLDLARRDVPGCQYHVSQTRPPIPMPVKDQKFDLIYAYSVFSHLPENLANEWIEEFADALKPGGIACLTTRPRAHIEISGTAAATGAYAEQYAEIFKDKSSALAQYDSGNFVFYPQHGGGSLSEKDYGEAVIPLTYALKNWSKHLEVINLYENYSSIFLQPCFVLRKK
jgi:SAM-dependent methyltransferase